MVMKHHVWPEGLERPELTELEMLHSRVYREEAVAMSAEDVLRLGLPNNGISLRAVGEDGFGVTAKQSRNYDPERVYVCPCCKGAVHGDEDNMVVSTQRADVDDDHQHVHPADTCFGAWLRRQTQIELIPFHLTTTQVLTESKQQPFRLRRRIPKDVIDAAIPRSA